MECRPGSHMLSHMLSVKKHSYVLFSRVKWGKRETVKAKTRRKNENTPFHFYSQETSCLKNQHKGKAQFSLEVFCQKQIAIMTQCIKNQLTKKLFLALDVTRAKKKIKISIKNKSNKMQEQSP